MKTKELPPKPSWYLFAYDAVEKLDRVKPSKGGTREYRCILSTWKIAVSKHFYAGTEKDWELLLGRLGREKLREKMLRGVNKSFS